MPREAVRRTLNLMDEHTFHELLQSTPGDRAVLQQYADWLTERGDPRGEHLSAELGVYRAEDDLKRAVARLAEYRSTLTQHFDWLNDVFPLHTVSSIPGTIYRAPSPDAAPFIEVGTMVQSDTTVAVIETQEVFYHITAGHCGLVTAILFEDRQQVDPGDCLLQIIRPQRHQVPGQCEEWNA